MDAATLSADRQRRVWLNARDADVDIFKAQVAKQTNAAEWPFAAEIQNNVPIYDGREIGSLANDAEMRLELMAEWVVAFDTGPGVIVIKAAMPDEGIVDKATEVFEQLVELQRREGSGGGDHFAKPGTNDRIWNVLEKHCLADPDNFARYYASDAIAMAAEAWLGRGYQMTAQMNRVNPGGKAQQPHRDYHLGFMTPDQMQSFPGHIHRISPVLTLQGAIAHCDMPVESGPTLFLPYSQIFFEGYLAFGRPEFQACFADHHVQLPLEKGDALFFNPALMHGAGDNTTSDIYRMANLLQVSSPFGRSMESVDRTRMANALYPALQAVLVEGSLSQREVDNAIAACAEGYAFPTNLDRDPPIGGLAPRTQADRMREALAQQMDPQEFTAEMARYDERRTP
jgi:ectoine hydroxylase-related dioxygenase (phytanoyl-CoA dioxygenase family)